MALIGATASVLLLGRTRGHGLAEVQAIGLRPERRNGIKMA